MPKTGAERQRERRERLRDDPDAWALYCARDRERKNKRREELQPDELLALRRRTLLSTREWRQTRVRTGTETPRSSTPYLSAATFAKARRKAERSLPQSPNKRVAVVKRLATEYLSLNISNNTTSRQSLDNNVKMAVLEHYQSDTISRVAPGKADVLTVRRDDGTKSKEQKRHMTMTISECFQIFKSDNPDCAIGKSSFAALRPKFVQLSSKMPQNVCGCKYHSNVILLLESLHRKCPTIPLYSQSEFLTHCVCDLQNEDCMSNNCENCSEGQKFESRFTHLDNLAEEMSWFQWGEDVHGYLVKQQQTGTIQEALTKLQVQLPKFSWHVFIKNKQSQAYEGDKAYAKQPESVSCVLQMDFAENYTATSQDEIQSAHWKQPQITIFTIMMWCRDVIKSSIIVSDVREHEKKSVSAYTYKALEMIREQFPFVENVNIWTDGPSSQFKNRYIFSLLGKLEERFPFKLTWNYSATSHGKGPNDALGGAAKRIVHRSVMSRNAVVYDANSFAAAVESGSPNIFVTVFSQTDIQERCSQLELNELWSQTPVVPGTINFHCVAPCTEGIQCKFYKSSENVRITSLRKPLQQQESKMSENDPLCSSDSEDIPLAQITKTQWPCDNCGWQYGKEDDPRGEEDWLRCDCGRWFHEGCAENIGVIGDETFTCNNCS